MSQNKKTILVTGATGAIGSVLSRHLAQKHYDLVLAARDTNKLLRLSNELKGIGQGKYECWQIDFSDFSSFKALPGDIKNGLDGLVMMPPQIPATDDCLPDSAQWERIFRESFIGPLELMKVCIPLLEKRRPSKVVIVSGISSAQVLGHYATSNVLRTSWLAEAKTLAFAYGPKGVHFNTLSLGGVMTEKYTDRLKKRAEENKINYDEQLEREVSNVPLRKYAAPNEVATAIEGLLSPFSDHITGMNILCDGGFTRSY